MLKILNMAKEKNGFILYNDIIHTVEELSDEQAGKLFKHILRYVNDKNPITEDVLIKIAFEPIKQSLKRDLVKYENIRTKNKENALKRWNATASESMQTDTKNADSDSVSDSVRVKDNIDYQAMLEFINTSFGRNFRVMNNSIKDKYKSLLKQGYTKQQIIDSINNCKENDYHKQNNYQYCTPEFFSRSVTIDKYSEKSTIQNVSKFIHNEIID